MFEPMVRVHDCRNPDDDMYLELALEADAEVIVSGDADLLDLSPWRRIPVLTASGYLRFVSERAGIGQAAPAEPDG